MPGWVARVLDWPRFALFARIVLTFPFWSNGLSRIVHFAETADDLAIMGVEPAGLINLLVIFTQIGGSLLIVANRRTWSGAGALAIFTLLTIPVAHDFWNLNGHTAQSEINIVVEHIGLIGGLMLAAILSRQSPLLGA